MTIRIKVVGCNRYSFKGEIFDRGFFYDLEDTKARVLLDKTDDYGRPYFARVETPIEDEVIIEETRSEEVDGVRIRRSRGRPRKNPIVKTTGDTAPLEAEDRTPAPAVVTDDGLAEGIEV